MQPGGQSAILHLEKTEPFFLTSVWGLLALCNLPQFLHLENEDNDPDLYKGVHSRWTEHAI